jgi:hypothetical protein
MAAKSEPSGPGAPELAHRRTSNAHEEMRGSHCRGPERHERRAGQGRDPVGMKAAAAAMMSLLAGARVKFGACTRNGKVEAGRVEAKSMCGSKRAKDIVNEEMPDIGRIKRTQQHNRVAQEGSGGWNIGRQGQCVAQALEPQRKLSCAFFGGET